MPPAFDPPQLLRNRDISKECAPIERKMETLLYEFVFSPTFNRKVGMSEFFEKRSVPRERERDVAREIKIVFLRCCDILMFERYILPSPEYHESPIQDQSSHRFAAL